MYTSGIFYVYVFFSIPEDALKRFFFQFYILCTSSFLYIYMYVLGRALQNYQPISANGLCGSLVWNSDAIPNSANFRKPKQQPFFLYHDFVLQISSGLFLDQQFIPKHEKWCGKNTASKTTAHFESKLGSISFAWGYSTRPWHQHGIIRTSSFARPFLDYKRCLEIFRWRGSHDFDMFLIFMHCISGNNCESIGQIYPIYLAISLSLSIYLSIYLSICLSVYLSICLSVYLSICLSICLSVYLSIYLPIYLSIYLSMNTHTDIYIYIYSIYTYAPPPGKQTWQ